MVSKMSASESVLNIHSPIPVLNSDKIIAICYRIEFSILRFSSLQFSEGDCLQSPKFFFGNNEEFTGRILLYPNGQCHKKCMKSDSESQSFCIFLQYVKCDQWVVNNDRHLKGTVQFSLKRDKTSRVNIGRSCVSITHDPSDSSVSMCGICNSGSTDLRAHFNLYKNTSLHVICEITLQVQATLKVKVNTSKPIDTRNKLNEKIGGFIHNTDVADVTILSGGQECKVHRVILAARSPVFARMFQTEMAENQRNIVLILDMDFSVVISLLVYMYTDNVPGLDTHGEALLSAAEKYQVDGLKEKCEASLAEGLTVENAARVFLVADLHRAKLLKEKAGEFIIKNIQEVQETEGWRRAKQDHPKVLLKALIY